MNKVITVVILRFHVFLEVFSQTFQCNSPSRSCCQMQQHQKHFRLHVCKTCICFLQKKCISPRQNDLQQGRILGRFLYKDIFENKFHILRLFVGKCHEIFFKRPANFQNSNLNVKLKRYAYQHSNSFPVNLLMCEHIVQAFKKIRQRISAFAVSTFLANNSLGPLLKLKKNSLFPHF